MYDSNYYFENKEQRIESIVNYQKRELKKKGKLYFTNQTRSLILNILKGRQKTSKRIKELLGYSASELRSKVYSTIPEGKNFVDFLNGDLVLEHIIPIAYFDYSNNTEQSFLNCWDLNNLRITTPEENREKGSSIDMDLIKEYKITNLLEVA